MLELHCHTTCSDGILSPTELVVMAVQAGVKGLAISDHDTLAGWEEAVEAAQPYHLEIIPAVELSTVWRGRSLHLLGFYPDPQLLNPPLQERQQGRMRRAAAMLDKLATLGYPITLPFRNLSPGRPHIAQALVEAGYVRNSREAFDRFLAEGGSAFVPYEKFSAVEGIDLLRRCGAVPVWAHPPLFKGDSVERTLRDLVAAGLLGLEVYHPEHSRTTTATLLDLANRYHLLITGGSDYHGPNPRGHSLNMMKLEMKLLDRLKQVHQAFCMLPVQEKN
ncbi:MAG: PHP domain-containing protein [Cyanobacteriota bacterium]|nr:PHP domain-containing protein [Cyanobacteriota bacterium]